MLETSDICVGKNSAGHAILILLNVIVLSLDRKRATIGQFCRCSISACVTGAAAVTDSEISFVIFPLICIKSQKFFFYT